MRPNGRLSAAADNQVMVRKKKNSLSVTLKAFRHAMSGGLIKLHQRPNVDRDLIDGLSAAVKSQAMVKKHIDRNKVHQQNLRPSDLYIGRPKKCIRSPP